VATRLKTAKALFETLLRQGPVAPVRDSKLEAWRNEGIQDMRIGSLQFGDGANLDEDVTELDFGSGEGYANIEHVAARLSKLHSVLFDEASRFQNPLYLPKHQLIGPS